MTLETGPGLGSEDTEDSSPCSPETHSPVGLQGKDCYQSEEGQALKEWFVIATGSFLESFLEEMGAELSLAQVHAP